MAILDYKRMPIEIEAPEQFGYENIKYNLAESSVFDFHFNVNDFELNNLKLAYCDHLGKVELREKIIGKCSSLTAKNVLITNGAAGALFIVSTSILDKKDHLIVVAPNYANNIETPNLIGCDISKINLEFENQFKLSIKEIEKSIKPNTKLISLTTPHNPTGTILNKEEVKEIVLLANKYNIRVLIDETYKGLTEGDDLPYFADLHENVISVASLSKSYGLPGIRIGWVITQDEKLFNTFLAAKEQIHLSNSIIDEEIAYQFLLFGEDYLREVKKHVNLNFNILKNWVTENDFIEWVEPKGGVVCFPKITANIDVKKFYEILNHKYLTWVGPGHWFDCDKKFIRIGYGWPTLEEFKQGLKNISLAIEESKK